VRTRLVFLYSFFCVCFFSISQAARAHSLDPTVFESVGESRAYFEFQLESQARKSFASKSKKALVVFVSFDSELNSMGSSGVRKLLPSHAQDPVETRARALSFSSSASPRHATWKQRRDLDLIHLAYREPDSSLAFNAIKSLADFFDQKESVWIVGLASGSGARSLERLDRLLSSAKLGGLDALVFVDALGMKTVSETHRDIPCWNLSSVDAQPETPWAGREEHSATWGSSIGGCSNFEVRVREHSTLRGQAFSIAEDWVQRFTETGLLESLARDYWLETQSERTVLVDSKRFSEVKVYSLLPELQQAHLKLRPDAQDYLEAREKLRPKAVARSL
jgi:hypothetical protein